ncbi:MAG: poly-beta-1,6-N-acetyl-D-glucosamine synthase [Pseudomonadales bacterium]
MDAAFQSLLNFTFYYPLFMSILWITASVYYFYYREKEANTQPEHPPELDVWPGVSFIVPCHNEMENIEETVRSLLAQDYPEFEIIVINDASSDETGAILDRLAAAHPQVRVVHFASNQGKAMGLRVGSLTARHDVLVCLDGDALLTPQSTRWLAHHFALWPRVGAVTGNPRVRNRTTLLGRIQVGEFSSIIGLLKRAQRIYGRVFTVSGVVAAFRKVAVHQVDYWGLNVMTEDIDISWRLQLNHWDIRYEPNALCWILMPETFGGLWRQRLRWAQGGIEVLVNHMRSLFRWRTRRMWLVATELVVSTFWAYTMALVFSFWLLGQFVALPAPLDSATILPGWSGLLLGTTCLLQFAVSLVIDSRYERQLGRVYYWMVWYPMLYWIIQVVTSVTALPRALARGSNRRAIWRSPDRGLRDTDTADGS